MSNLQTRKPATLADVARAAGVSKGTASNVFNRPDIVRMEVRERVLSAARAAGYAGPDPRGRLLSAGKVNAIGVATVEPLATFFDDPFARVLMTGITEVCDANGIGISLVSAANEEQLAWNISSAVVDGFILFCLKGGERLVELSRERHLPFVALDFGDGDETMSAVGVDNVAAARLAARHLGELGHRRFAILTMELEDDGVVGRIAIERARLGSYPASRDRVAGYLLELEGHGVSPADVPIYETLSDRTTVEAALAEIFAAPLPPTAILAQSDKIALIALRWLAARGLSVPQNVSIVGFDGVPESASSSPPLTTVRQPIAEIGRRAVNVILNHGGKTLRETVPVDLIVRGSTALPLQQKAQV
jgi:DNA-binding LacI/PurR family transcriptional regulator